MRHDTDERVMPKLEDEVLKAVTGGYTYPPFYFKLRYVNETTGAYVDDYGPRPRPHHRNIPLAIAPGA